MRVFGRVNGVWQVVETDAAGFNDDVYLTALAQDLQLNLGESPFYANNGIPAQQSVITQVYPDYYAMMAQVQYSKYFASLIIARVAKSNPPFYNVTAVTNRGAILAANIPI
jgi:hypothetical protein